LVVSNHFLLVASVKERFDGVDGKRRLTDLLLRQRVVSGIGPVAEELFELVAIRVLPVGTSLIQQEDEDTDLHFILSGKVSVQVNGREVAIRTPGSHVGEMALIDPSAKRCAAVVAISDTVVASVTESAFTGLAQRYPYLWRNLAIELASRLRERNELVARPNPRPVLFIGSSAEALPLTQAIQSGLAHEDILVKPWTCNIFQPSNYPVDDLLAAVYQSDFAVLVVSPDDRIASRGERFDAPRDNVIYELGLAMGHIGRHRTVMVVPRGEDLKIPSDLAGLNPVTFKVGPEGDLAAAIGPVCNDLRALIGRLGCK